MNPPSYPRAVLKAIRRPDDSVVLWRIDDERWYYQDNYYPPPLTDANLQHATNIGWYIGPGLHQLSDWTDLEFLPTATADDRIALQIARLS